MGTGGGAAGTWRGGLRGGGQRRPAGRGQMAGWQAANRLAGTVMTSSRCPAPGAEGTSASRRDGDGDGDGNGDRNGNGEGMGMEMGMRWDGMRVAMGWDGDGGGMGWGWGWTWVGDGGGMGMGVGWGSPQDQACVRLGGRGTGSKQGAGSILQCHGCSGQC